MITMQAHPGNTEPVFHLFVIMAPEAERFVEYMAGRGIECHRHYPVPCPYTSYYSNLFSPEYKAEFRRLVDSIAKETGIPYYDYSADPPPEEVGMVIEACNQYEGKG